MLRTVALTLAAGVLAGRLLGGRISNLANLRLRWLPVLYAALAVGLLPLFVEVSASGARALVVGAYAMLAVFLVRVSSDNRGAIRAGFIVLTIGWSLNALAISVNEGMPLSLEAYERSGQTENITAGQGGFFKIVIADDRTRLGFLGDVVPVQPLRSVVSVGDILLSIGVGITVVGAMKSKTINRGKVIPPTEQDV